MRKCEDETRESKKKTKRLVDHIVHTEAKYKRFFHGNNDAYQDQFSAAIDELGRDVKFDLFSAIDDVSA